MHDFWFQVGWRLVLLPLSRFPGAISMRLQRRIYPDEKMIGDLQVDALREGLRLTNNSGVPMAVVALKLTNTSPYLGFEFDGIRLNIEQVIRVTLDKHERIERGDSLEIWRDFSITSEQSTYLAGKQGRVITMGVSIDLVAASRRVRWLRPVDIELRPNAAP